MNRFSFAAALTVGALALSGTGLTESKPTPVTTTQGLPAGAKMDLTNGVLVAEGKGTAAAGLTQAQSELRALAAARADAQRVLLGALQGVQITSETSVKDFELQSDEIKASISGLLKNAAPVKDSEKIEKKQDGSLIARVSFQVPLYGEDGSVAAATFPSVPKNPTPSSTDPTPPPSTEAKYRGLVVDARGKGYVPCLVPKIKPTTGEEQWATEYADEPQAKKAGVAAFVRRLEDAKVLKFRGAPDQLTIKAVKASGPSKCDVEVSDADAANIKKYDESGKFLETFKVTFVF